MRIGMILSTPIPAQEEIGFYVWNLSNQLKQKGHEIVIITRGGSNENTSEEINGINIFRLPFLPLNPFRARMYGRLVDQLLKKLNDDIDLLHLHTTLIKAPNTDKPVVVTVHRPLKTDIRDASNSPVVQLVCLVNCRHPPTLELSRHSSTMHQPCQQSQLA